MHEVDFESNMNRQERAGQGECSCFFLMNKMEAEGYESYAKKNKGNMFPS